MDVSIASRSVLPRNPSLVLKLLSLPQPLVLSTLSPLGNKTLGFNLALTILSESFLADDL